MLATSPGWTVPSRMTQRAATRSLSPNLKSSSRCEAKPGRRGPRQASDEASKAAGSAWAGFGRRQPLSPISHLIALSLSRAAGSDISATNLARSSMRGLLVRRPHLGCQTAGSVSTGKRSSRIPLVGRPGGCLAEDGRHRTHRSELHSSSRLGDSGAPDRESDKLAPTSRERATLRP